MSGKSPVQDQLILTRDADFVHTYPATSETLPSGTTARIVITKTAALDSAVLATWTATVTESEIAFRVQQTDTNMIPAGARYRMLVTFPEVNGAVLDECWFRGKIIREQ